MTSTDTTATTTTAAREVEALQRAWIFGWDKTEGVALAPFEEVFALFYDLDADVLFFDDADPQRRLFRSVGDYAAAFWPTFSALRSAVHAIAEEPEADLADDGSLAVTRMVFVAVLTAADGAVTRLRCVSSQSWRPRAEGGWYVVRDHTSCYPLDEATAASYGV